MESTCYLLLDEDGHARIASSPATRSSSAMWAGRISRRSWATLTEEDLAGFLYDSLNSKIMPLPDDVIVYPAHGAGSACGKNMSKETFDTLGHQKQVNYALLATTQGAVRRGGHRWHQLPPPSYFPHERGAEQGRLSRAWTAVLERGTEGALPGRTGDRRGKHRRVGARYARAADLQGRLHPAQRSTSA